MCKYQSSILMYSFLPFVFLSRLIGFAFRDFCCCFVKVFCLLVCMVTLFAPMGECEVFLCDVRYIHTRRNE